MIYCYHRNKFTPSNRQHESFSTVEPMRHLPCFPRVKWCIFENIIFRIDQEVSYRQYYLLFKRISLAKKTAQRSKTVSLVLLKDSKLCKRLICNHAPTANRDPGRINFHEYFFLLTASSIVASVAVAAHRAGMVSKSKDKNSIHKSNERFVLLRERRP